MISTKDLMIGDWVYMEAHRGYEAQYIQVETIPDASSKDHYGHIGAFPVGGDNDFRDIEDRHLFPIPLTAEILEKNGWRSRMNGTGEFYLKKPLVDAAIITKTIAGFQMNHGPFNRLSIHYVHQLQHALQLCGIEKEIML